MRYLLTVLTNGRADCLARTLAAFRQHARPAPAAVHVVDDGGLARRQALLALLHDQVDGDIPVEVISPARPLGMCAAHALCWDAAAASPLEWAFHLEDDYVLLRPLRLARLAKVIEAEAHLRQMALVRTPWGFEVAHGGYIPQTPGHYVRQRTGGREWMATRRNWTTCPALFRTQLARDFPWSPLPGCETEFGPRLLAADPEATFGLWGWGECWAGHIGVTRQPGAHGY